MLICLMQTLRISDKNGKFLKGNGWHSFVGWWQTNNFATVLEVIIRALPKRVYFSDLIETIKIQLIDI